eukprot:jgi/Hompol1/399/HPOL_002510-RA
MSSKAVDVFMKHIGSDYLRSTLQGPVSDIIMSGKNGELDPTKIEKTDKLEKELQKNFAALIRFNTQVVDAIFTSLAYMPEPLRDFFWFLQDTVTKKFADDPVVRYTCISGFIFLRFFAPAVLGPKLFGLDVGIIDARSARNLLLVAKTLQNLSNLVEFGQKEPYMAPMNAFIQARMAEMKQFIEGISKAPLCSDSATMQADLSLLPPLHKVLTDRKKESAMVARECAELQGIVLASLDKILAADTSGKISQKLPSILSTLDETRQSMIAALGDQDLTITPWQSDDDVAVPAQTVPDAADDDAAKASNTANVSKEDEDERKIIRMLTRCSSSSIRSSLGSFRQSTELRDSIIKSLIKPDVYIPSMPSLRRQSDFATRVTPEEFASAAVSPPLVLSAEHLDERTSTSTRPKTSIESPSTGEMSGSNDKMGSRSKRGSLTSRVASGLGFFNK